MKLTIATQDLNYGLNIVTRAISPRAVKNIYNGVHISAQPEKTLLTCTDGDMSIQAEIPAVVEVPGEAVLPGKFLYDLARYQTGDTVLIEAKDSGRVRIVSGASSSNLMGMDPDEFPEIYEIERSSSVFVPCARYKDALGSVLFAVSNDESRKILTGVLTEVYPGEIITVGLDGFRMAMRRLPRDVIGESRDKIAFVVPGRCVSEIAKILPDDEKAEMEMRLADNRIEYIFDNVKVFSTLLNGEFIDYQRILPKTWTTQIKTSTQAFDRSVERCSLMAREGKNNLIYFKINNDGTLEMRSSAEKGEVRDEIVIQFEGNELEIAFNSKYLLDVIKNIGTEQVCMCFNSKVSPCMVIPPEGNDYLFLVLPVRV